MAEKLLFNATDAVLLNATDAIVQGIATASSGNGLLLGGDGYLLLDGPPSDDVLELEAAAVGGRPQGPLGHPFIGAFGGPI